MTGELRLPFFGKEKHMATNSMGTTLQFTPSGGTQVTVGKLSSIGELSPDSEELDVTTLDATGGYREYIQGLRDAGELEIEGYHNAGDNGQAALRAAYASGDCGSFVITFPDNTTAAFSAFVKSHTLGAAEVDGAVGFGATLRITGAIAITPAT